MILIIGNVLRGFLVNRQDTKFINPNNLYAMTSGRHAKCMGNDGKL
jgi:hypothetical protein